MRRENFFDGARVVVTGAAGTVGRELVRQLLGVDVGELRALDNNENGLFFLEQEYRDDKRFHAFLCDVREYDKLSRMFEGMTAVFHAAALKHVPSCERSPTEAVRTNILGVENVFRAALAKSVGKVLFTSSDKAVNPTNVMGTSKLMGERLITAANALTTGGNGPVFASTRFGNVAGSAGSVIPLFCEQIREGRDLTLTHNDMTRFVMTLHEAVRLVMESMALARGGEVFVTKMPVARIRDLAVAVRDIVAPVCSRSPADVAIVETGPRPGEKFYEELISEEEIRRTYEIRSMFVVLPAFRNIYDDIDYEYPGIHLEPIAHVYNSSAESVMGESELREFLLQPSVLPAWVTAKR